MLRRFDRSEPAFIAVRCAPVSLLLVGLAVLAPQSRAQINLGPVTVGAGLQTSYDHTATNGGRFQQPVRSSITLRHLHQRTCLRRHQVHVQYRLRQRHQQDRRFWTRWRNSNSLLKFNIWVGRFLPPSDRANLYGPFYSNEWKVYTDGVQDGYPFVYQGRDNGVCTGATFAKKVKVSVGVFDGKSADWEFRKSSEPRAFRSISGIQRTATT